MLSWNWWFYAESDSLDSEDFLSFLYVKFCSSVPQSCPTLCNPMDYICQASLSFTIFWSLLTLTSIESVMPSHHLILCYPLFPLPSIFSSIRVFANEEVYTEVSPVLSCAWGRRCSSAMTPFSRAGSLSYCVGSCFWSAGPSELACGTNPLCHFQCSRKRHSIPEV